MRRPRIARAAHVPNARVAKEVVPVITIQQPLRMLCGYRAMVLLDAVVDPTSSSREVSGRLYVIPPERTMSFRETTVK
jgi:hypothetical protein